MWPTTAQTVYIVVALVVLVALQVWARTGSRRGS